MFSSLKTKSRIAVLAVAAVLGTSAQAAEITGAPRNQLYNTALAWKRDGSNGTDAAD